VVSGDSSARVLRGARVQPEPLPTSLPTVLRLYDTRLRDVVDIVPATSGILRIYACGPTVYKPQHVGNLRSSLLPDLIGRVAEWNKLRVRYVQNVTDVGHLDESSTEDKLIREAR
jgi:cysteinyl-tRNA synthetase